MGKNSNNYWVKSGFFAILQRISIPVFGVGTFLIIVRTLSPQEMGTWVLFTSTVTIIEVSRNGLIKAALVKYFTEANQLDKPNILAASFYINLIYTIITQCILVFGGEWIGYWLQSDQLGIMLTIYTANALLFIPFSHFEYVQQANLNFKGIFISYFIKQGWFFVCIVGLIVFLNQHVTLIDLVWLQTSGVLLGALSSYITARPYLAHIISPSKKWFKAQFSFGKYGLYTNISNSALTSTDHMLIGGILSTASVAIHNVAARITNVFIIPSVAVADILYPKTVQANDQNGVGGVKDLYAKAVGATLVPMVPVIIAVELLPDLFIRVLAGEQYLSATLILRVTILSILFTPFLKQFGTVVNTLNKPQLNFYFVLAIAIFNIGLNYVCIITMGLVGGAVATLISYIVAFVASQYILHRIADISTRDVLIQTINFYIRLFKWSKKKLITS